MTDRDLHPAQISTTRSLARPTPRQVLNLSMAVASTLGGTVLLASNVAVVLIAEAGTLPWIALGANVALIFGGVMFAREYRRGDAARK